MSKQRNLKSVLLHLALVVGLVASSQSAFADKARELHAKGVELFEKSQFLAAAEAFREAQKLRPTWKLYYNIGQCEASARRFGLALEAFEAYLVQGGDEVPEDRLKYVTEEIRRLQPLVGTIDVEAPEGLSVLVDGHRRAATPLAGPLRVSAGKHKVSVKSDEETLYNRTVNVAGGMETKIEVSRTEPAAATGPESEAEPEPEPEAEPEPMVETTPQPDGERSPLWGIGWAGFGVGLAVAAVGTITGVAAMNKSNELDEKCPDRQNCSSEHEHLKGEAETLALTTDIMLPVGAALTVTGIVLVILGRKKESAEPSGDLVSVKPVVWPQGNGLTIEGRF